MAKLNRLLLIALLLQAGIFVVAKLWPKAPSAGKPKALFTFKAGDVMRLEIVDGGDAAEQKKRVVLKRRAGSKKQKEKWFVASGGGYPTTDKKVSTLLGKLAAVKAGLPVSQRATHQRKLEVATARFQRQITVGLRGGKTIKFFLGSSPSLKKVHLRFDGKKDIFAAGPLSTWDIGASASSWVDTDYFKLERDRIVSFSLTNKHGRILVRRVGKRWVLGAPGAASQPAGRSLDQTEVDSLVGTLSYVTLRDPVGKLESSQGFASPAAVLVVHTRAAQQAPATTQPTSSPASSPASAPASRPAEPLIAHRLRIGAKRGTAYYAKRDGSPFVVTVDSSTADALVGQKLAALLKKKKKKGSDDKGAKKGQAGAFPAIK